MILGSGPGRNSAVDAGTSWPWPFKQISFNPGLDAGRQILNENQPLGLLSGRELRIPERGVEVYKHAIAAEQSLPGLFSSPRKALSQPCGRVGLHGPFGWVKLRQM